MDRFARDLDIAKDFTARVMVSFASQRAYGAPDERTQ